VALTGTDWFLEGSASRCVTERRKPPSRKLVLNGLLAAGGAANCILLRTRAFRP